MKKTIFLSFRPEFFRPLLYGIKKYEYRKRFCKEETTAYLYLSAPVKEVIGIVEFGKVLNLAELKEKNLFNPDVINRINRCIDNEEKYAIPIESLQLFKEPIPFQKLKSIDNKFTAPHCYCILNNYSKVYDFLKIQEMYGIEFYHCHDKIFKENIGVYCAEMESTDGYKLLDTKYKNNMKYKIIKC